jgi:hypothetical protein
MASAKAIKNAAASATVQSDCAVCGAGIGQWQAIRPPPGSLGGVGAAEAVGAGVWLAGAVGAAAGVSVGVSVGASVGEGDAVAVSVAVAAMVGVAAAVGVSVGEALVSQSAPQWAWAWVVGYRSPWASAAWLG